jgi:threonine/homoserine/homoserine lactone efflux protein
MDPIIKGIISGVTISLMIGPIFFALVDLTISKGWKAGFIYVWGVILSDVVMIPFINSFIGIFDLNGQYKLYMGFIGGSLLILFGIFNFFVRGNIQNLVDLDIKTIAGAFMKGVTINVLNPFVWIWWVGVYTAISPFDYDQPDKFLYYFFLLLMVFLFDLVKIRFAYYLKQRMSIDNLHVVKQVAGVCLFVFGVLLIYRSI